MFHSAPNHCDSRSLRDGSRRGQSALATVGSLAFATLLTLGFLFGLRFAKPSGPLEAPSPTHATTRLEQTRVEPADAEPADSVGTEPRTILRPQNRVPTKSLFNPEPSYQASPNAAPKVQRADSPDAQRIRIQYHVPPTGK